MDICPQKAWPIHACVSQCIEYQPCVKTGRGLIFQSLRKNCKSPAASLCLCGNAGECPEAVAPRGKTIAWSWLTAPFCRMCGGEFAISQYFWVWWHLCRQSCRYAAIIGRKLNNDVWINLLQWFYHPNCPPRPKIFYQRSPPPCLQGYWTGSAVEFHHIGCFARHGILGVNGFFYWISLHRSFRLG